MGRERERERERGSFSAAAEPHNNMVSYIKEYILKCLHLSPQNLATNLATTSMMILTRGVDTDRNVGSFSCFYRIMHNISAIHDNLCIGTQTVGAKTSHSAYALAYLLGS